MWQLKLDNPPHFEGQHDMEIVESWVYQLENYFALTNVVDTNIQARYATLLLTKSAAIWLKTKEYDLTTLTWPILK